MTIYTGKELERIHRRIAWAALKRDMKRLGIGMVVFAIIIGIYALAGSV